MLYIFLLLKLRKERGLIFYMSNNELENVQNKFLNQEEVNNQLQNICIQLKKIQNIGMNYLEYISAIIYVLYEYMLEFEQTLTKNNNMEYILNFIEDKLEQIRRKDSKKLFINIRFKDCINKQNYDSFKQILLNLFNLILNLEKEYNNSKSILAESFEFIILKAVQSGYTSLNSNEYYTPKGVVISTVPVFPVSSLPVYKNLENTCATARL